MKRRTFITTVGVGLLTQTPLIDAAPAAMVPTSKPSTAAEREPFIKIAKAKGVKIAFDAVVAEAEVSSLHLDMNMVRASI
jgi:hypothetical protein